MQALPAVLSPSETAFFFDFDGTLVELAPTPDGVLVQPRVIDLLRELSSLTNGAVAVVSGRGIDSIDSFLGMCAAFFIGAQLKIRDSARRERASLGNIPIIAVPQIGLRCRRRQEDALARTKETRANAAPGAGTIFTLRAIGLVLAVRWLFSMSEMNLSTALTAMASSPWA